MLDNGVPVVFEDGLMEGVPRSEIHAEVVTGGDVDPTFADPELAVSGFFVAAGSCPALDHSLDVNMRLVVRSESVPEESADLLGDFPIDPEHIDLILVDGLWGVGAR